MSSTNDASASAPSRPVRVGYLVSHPIQYQAPLLRRIALEPDLDLTVLFGSDHSVRAFKDEGFGVSVTWDVPLLDGYKHEFLKPLRDTGTNSPTSPISRNLLASLIEADGSPRFDVLWVHGYASVNSLLAIVAANAHGIPVLLRAESWLADRPRSAATLYIKRIFFRVLAKLIDAVLPIGSHNSLYWREYLRSTPQFVMPYAVDNAFFASRAEEARPHLAGLRAELDIAPDRPVVLFASKLVARKNAPDLLAAFHEVIKSHNASEPAPCLVIVGDGEQRAELELYVRQHSLQHHVRFAGFRNQSALPAFFALASVFVLPSRDEPWGLIVNEAMAAGCAVIVSDAVGCAIDLIADNIEGIITPCGDRSALAAAITRVLATPASAASMGEAAQARMLTWSYDEDIAGLRAAIAHTTRKLVP